MTVGFIFYLLETMGICVFALSGLVLAKRKDFDPVGLYIIACVTAFGGGTLRDVILDVQPVYWISRSEYPVVILVMTALFYLVPRFTIKSSWLIVPDALGLALFSITGAQVAMATGLPPMITAIMAVMTSTFGGLSRDILCRETPMIFQKVSLYASVSFVGAWLYMMLLHLGLVQPAATVSAVAFIFLFRLLAVRFNWRFS